MSEPKSFASLGPTLLARKGGARPAMRSQLNSGQLNALGLETDPASQLEDLGWNDMGVEKHSAEVLPLTPLAANSDAEAETIESAESAKPEIVRQQAGIAAKIAAKPSKKAAMPSKKDVQAKPRHPRTSALEKGRRAAFTLRLDAERHLKLRLACTIRGRSAQQIVTKALDALLADMPELESLAAQIKSK